MVRGTSRRGRSSETLSLLSFSRSYPTKLLFSAHLGIRPDGRQCPKSVCLLLQPISFSFAYETSPAGTGEAGTTLSWQELWTQMLAHSVPVYTHTDAHTWSPEPYLRVLSSYLTSEGPSRYMCHLFFSRAQDKKRKNYVPGNRLWIPGMVWQLRIILLIASHIFDPISSVQRI